MERLRLFLNDFSHEKGKLYDFQYDCRILRLVFTFTYIFKMKIQALLITERVLGKKNFIF